MKKCLTWMKEKACWAVSAVLFMALTGAVILYENSGKMTYPILFLGDSIVGNVRDETSITSLLEQGLGVSIYNGAFGGSTMAKREALDQAASMANCISMTELAASIAAKDFSVQNAGITACAVMEYFPEAAYGFSEIDLKGVEVIFLEHGANDYQTGVPLDNPEDPMDIYTFGGALRYVLQTLRESQPDTKIVLCTPTFIWYVHDRTDCIKREFGYGGLEAYVDLEIEIAAEYGVDVIDNYHDSGIGGADAAFEEWPLYTEDGLHLNERGRKLIADRIMDYMKGLTQ